MNVLAGSGLVGIVTEVGPTWAKVRSIIDDANNVSGMVLSTSDTCIVSGDLSLMNTGQITFDQMENNDNTVSVGDQIVTSYISDKYLQGILIGSVSEINVDSNNLTRSGYITPAVDFRNIQEVLVITTTKQNLQGKTRRSRGEIDYENNKGEADCCHGGCHTYRICSAVRCLSSACSGNYQAKSDADHHSFFRIYEGTEGRHVCRDRIRASH